MMSSPHLTSMRGRVLERGGAILFLAALLSCEGSPTQSGFGVPAHMDIVSGDGQEAVVGHALPNPLVVKVTDASGNPVANQVVNFVVVSGGGSVFAGSANTTAQGLAQEIWTLGIHTDGEQKLEVRAVDGNTGEPIVFAMFTATAKPDVPAALTVVGNEAPAGAVGEALPDSLAVKVVDQHGNGVPDQTVTWTVEAGGGSVSPATRVTDATGVARTAWTLGARLDTIQKAKVTLGSLEPLFFIASPSLPATATITKLNDGQEGAVTQALAQPLVAVVRLADGRPVRGAVVTWTVSSGAGSLSATTSVTDAEGRASTSLTLGNGAGATTVTATVAGLAPATFTATGHGVTPAQMAKVSGDRQVAPAGGLLPQPLVVLVKDLYGNPVSGATVTWAPSKGSADPASSVTGTDGQASTQWTIGQAGTASLTASIGGISVTFTATGTTAGATLSLVSGNNQSGIVGDVLFNTLVVKLLDASGAPIADAAVTWTVTKGTSTVRAAAGTASTPNIGPTDGSGLASAYVELSQRAETLNVQASVPDAAPVGFTAIANPGPMCTVTLGTASGSRDAGTAPAGSPVPNPLYERAVDLYGNLVPEYRLRSFSVGGGGSISTVETQPGERRWTWTLGAQLGTQTITYETWFCTSTTGRASNVNTRLDNIPKTVTATATNPAAVTTLEKISGDNQSAAPGAQLPAPLVVRALDAAGAGMPNVPVSWAVTSGGGSAGATIITDADGYARNGWQLGPTSGPQTLTASASGATPVQFTATATALVTSSLGIVSGNQQVVLAGGVTDALTVRATNSNAVPVPGTSVSWSVTEGAGSVSPPNGTTDASGQTSSTLTLGATPGSNTVVATTDGASPATFQISGAIPFRAISAGTWHTCGLSTSGAAFCWGSDNFGQLGSGRSGGFESLAGSAVPRPVLGGLTLASITSGSGHTCGLTADGSAFCWGRGDFGQLGNGNTSQSSLPSPVAGGLKFLSLRAIGNNTCGVATDHYVYCWGNNRFGQLGYTSTRTCRESLSNAEEACAVVPQPIAIDRTFRSVDLGVFHACGVTTDGAAYCWGYNAYGQLGNGATSDSPTPVAVSTSLTFDTLAAGELHNCALSGGAAYCWGYNGIGGLGNGTMTNSSVPVAVSGGASFAALTAGAQFSCGTATGGQVQCWGTNANGQLGAATSETCGSSQCSRTPIQVGTFAPLDAGAAHACALATTGQAFCWGSNQQRQIGAWAGANTSRPTPVRGPDTY